MINQFQKYRVLFLCLLLGIVTFAVYWPVHNHEFVRYDDDTYVTKNPEVQSGLSQQNIKWAFTTIRGSNWHPLTWLSLMLDCRLFGVNAGALHLVNVIFHIANTVLVLLVLNRMTKRLWPSVFVAALFALHPLHVESVAWAAERKDVLSTFFWLLTMFAYVRYSERPSVIRYLITLLLFVMGLMSKPMLVTLPCVLLLLDYWPLERFQSSKKLILLLEKVPLFALSGASGVITYIAQHKGGAMAVIAFRERVANAIYSYLVYIGKMIWPSRLAVLYPYPADMIPVGKAVVYTIILVFITVLVVYYGQRHKYLLVGWFWYLGTLVPVIGIVQVGTQAMADRYTYVPLIGLFIIISFGAADVFVKIPFNKVILAVSGVMVLAACTVVTSIQLRYWKNSFVLFDHALAVIENNYVMQNNYGNVLSEQGKPEEAAKHIAEALKHIPNSPEIHVNYGNALKDLGRIDEAIEQYKFAIKLNPNMALAHYNLGVALAAQGKYDEAIEQYRNYLGPGADLSQPYEDLANALARQGKVEEAVGQYQRALAARPGSVEVLSNLGYAMAQSGKPQQAVEYYNKALEIEPNEVITHGRLALVLASLGKIDEAIEQCQIVLKARPNDAEMYNNLGILLYTKGRFDDAIESYQKAIQIDPNFVKARDNLSAAIARKQSGRK